jgi:hypothetical protein
MLTVTLCKYLSLIGRFTAIIALIFFISGRAFKARALGFVVVAFCRPANTFEAHRSRQ